MWFRLASLWGCTVHEAQARCDSREFAEWLAFYQLDPFGEERADYRSALQTANIRRALGDDKSKLEDFLLHIGLRERPVNDWRAVQKNLQVWAQAWNRQNQRKRKHGHND